MREGMPKARPVESVSIEKTESSFDTYRIAAEGILGEIDEQVLGELYEEERRRSGASVEEVKTVTEFRDISALGIHLEGIVTLNPKLIHEYAERNSIGFKQAVLSIYIHERTHAHGHNSIEHPSLITFLKSFVSSQETVASGYSRGFVQRMMPKSSFNLFNEGVTDSIAAEVFDSYGIQTGDSSLRNTSFASVYLEQRALVESFIALLSRKIGTPTEVIWQGIKQGYFHGQDLQDSEMAILYNELALGKVMTAIRDLDSKSNRDAETRQVAERIVFSSDEDLPSESVSRIRTYFEHVANTMRHS